MCNISPMGCFMGCYTHDFKKKKLKNLFQRKRFMRGVIVKSNKSTHNKFWRNRMYLIKNITFSLKIKLFQSNRHNNNRFVFLLKSRPYNSIDSFSLTASYFQRWIPKFFGNSVSLAKTNFRLEQGSELESHRCIVQRNQPQLIFLMIFQISGTELEAFGCCSRGHFWWRAQNF